MEGEFPLFDRKTRESREAEALASWALQSARSKGRAHHEEEGGLRTCFERDRDRIVHCTAFRRLMYKTQVFVNWEGDHNRTRLSHSLEVAQVARSVGSALFLNEALCEALGLAHDIGHPPFGHRGEWALDNLMSGHGGFRHNAQVLRVVDLLERRSPAYPGLNLTREARESLLKHESAEDWPDEFQPRPVSPYLEAQVVDLADSTAYDVHDVEDGLRAGMFTVEEIESETALWRSAASETGRKHPGFLEDSQDQALRVRRVANEILKVCINDLIRSSATRLAEAGLSTPESAQAHKGLLIGHSPELRSQVAELNAFLYRRFYRHPLLNELTDHATEVLGALFQAYADRPDEMAAWYVQWSESVGQERAVCDYIAGMTDRFAESEFERLTGRTPAWKESRSRASKAPR